MSTKKLSRLSLSLVATFAGLCLVFASPARALSDNNANTTIGTGVTSNNANANFNVGTTGTNNTLTITGGGVLTNVSIGHIGFQAGANNNTGTVTGSSGGTNSAWYISNSFYVGDYSSSNTLTIANGGKVVNSLGIIGDYGTNNNVLVTGTGSVWSNGSILYIGSSGDIGSVGAFNTLTISNAGKVVNTVGYIGYNDGANSNTVMVTGTNSAWYNTSNLYLGQYGSSNRLTIANGGIVFNTAGIIGNNTSASNNAVTVTGTGSVWTNSTDLYVGYAGSGNTLTIAASGTVFNTTGYIGYSTGADHNSVLVTGTNSIWNNSGDLYVGFDGSSNSLTIAAGGIVYNANGFIDDHALPTGSNNTVTVTGGGSVWSNRDDLIIGYINSGNTLIISNGGTVFNGNGLIGVNSGSSNNTVTVTGAGSTWNNSGALFIGLNGGNNRLNVLAGSAVNAGNLTVNAGTLFIDQQTTVHVSGTYTQTFIGILQLAIGGTLTNQYGSLSVAGTASLNGTLYILPSNGYTPSLGDTQKIVTAGTVTGTFSTFTNEIATGLKPKLIYLPGYVDLTWLSATTLFSPLAHTSNQLGLARNLDGASSDPRLSLLIAHLSSLPTNQLPAALDQLSPATLTAMHDIRLAGLDARGYNFLNRVNELRAGSHGFSANRLSLSDPNGPGQSLQPIAVTADAGQIYAMRADDPLNPTADNPWGVYVEGNGEFVNVHGDANASGYHLTSSGFTLGIDRRLGKELVVGVMVGYADMIGNLDNGGKMDVDNGQVSAYVTWLKEGLHVEGLVGGGYNSYNTRRIVLGEPAVGHTDGTEFTGLLGGGYDWQKGNWSFGPQLSLQYKRVDTSAFNESGSLAPLHIDSQSQESLQSRFGGRVGFNKTVGRGIIVTPELNMAWQHEYLNRGASVDARFVNGAGNTFTSYGPTIGRDSLTTGAGVSVQWTPTIGTFLNYSTEFGRTGYSPQSVNGGVGVRF